jgi:exodeoxyribonuclease VII large subunit
MATKDRIYTVGQVNSLVKAALNQTLPSQMTVRGEVRDFKCHHSGHCYFQLKDPSGVLPCVMWSSRFKSVKFSPEDGMAVLATGYVDVYAQGGKYQFYVDRLDPEGTGALQKAFEQMVAKLEAEGLFAEDHKRALPSYPRRVAVLTSESGAAWHDITDSIHRRWPAATLILCPVPVQGDRAAARIAETVTWINAHRADLDIDLMIVGRGGGSLEDLWAFNEEVLARAIYASRIPIISAVGHEIDITVADLVADARASTPTQAGIVAVPDQIEVSEDLEHCARRLAAHLRSRLDLCQAQVENLEAADVLRRPDRMIHDRHQCLDDMGETIRGLLQDRIRAAQDRLARDQAQLGHIEPYRLLGCHRVTVGELTGDLDAAITAVFAQRRLVLEAPANRLAALNPKSVLQRGFSITRSGRTGALVRQKGDIQPGDPLITELTGDIFIESQVTKL